MLTVTQSKRPLKLELRANVHSVTTIIPALAAEIGLEESLLLCQFVHWLGLSDHFHDGEYWTYQSVRELQRDTFPYMSVTTLSRKLNRLTDTLKLLKSRDDLNKAAYDKTRWYALNIPEMAKLQSVNLTVRGTNQPYPVSLSNTPFQNETPPFQNETPPFQNETTIPDKTPDKTPDKEKIDRSRDSLSTLSQSDPVPAELQTEPHDDLEEVQRGAQAVMAKLRAEGYDPDEPSAPLPPVDSTHIPYSMANGLGMTGFNDPYWQAFLAVKVEGQRQDKRVPNDVEEIVAQLSGMDAKHDEVERAVKWRLERRVAKTPYRFSFVPDDVRQYRESLLPPLERDAALAAAVQAGWQVAVGSDANNRLVDFLSGNVLGDMHKLDWGKFQFRADPLTAAEVTRFVGWYKSRNNDRKTPPATAKTLRERIDEFRAQRPVSASPQAAPVTVPRPAFTPEQLAEQIAERDRIKRTVLAQRTTEGVTP